MAALRMPAMIAVVMILPMACCAAGNMTGPTTAEATAPATNAVVTRCDSPKFAFSADYPSDWVPISKGDTFALALVPAGHGKDENRDCVGSLDVEVPKLPMHVPGMIPIGSVANGYVDDLRKHYGDVTVDERVVTTLAGVSGRRIVSSMKNNGRAWRDVAVLVCRHDRVYIISADSAAEDYEKTRAAFDCVVSAWKWK